jgi:hypothetical protein
MQRWRIGVQHPPAFDADERAFTQFGLFMFGPPQFERLEQQAGDPAAVRC